MTTYTTFQNVGTKEDVSAEIANITPTATPFVTSIKKEKVDNVLYQWQEDSLRAVQVNAKIEGFDAVEETLAPTVMRSNVTQILEKTFKISGSLDAVKSHGRAKESAYQLAKAGAEVKRDLEWALTGTRQTIVNTSGSARRFAGVQAQIDAAMVVATGGASTAMTEGHLLTALQRAWNEGADVSRVLCTGEDAINIADFAKAAGRFRQINNGTKDRAVINAVDLYVSPFGEVEIVASRFVAAGDTLVYDPSMFKLATLRDWTHEVLAKSGDNTKHMIVGEFGLIHKNYKAAARIVRQ